MSDNDRNYKEKVDEARERLASGEVEEAFQDGFDEVMETAEQLDTFEEDNEQTGE